MPLSWKLGSALALLISYAKAQDISSLPTCAQEAVITELGSSGCDLTDVACICANQEFISSMLPSVEEACSASDVQKTVEFAQNMCLSAGITLTVSLPSATVARSATPAPAAVQHGANGSVGTTATATAAASASVGSAGQVGYSTGLTLGAGAVLAMVVFCF